LKDQCEKKQANVVECKEEEEFYVFVTRNKGVIGNKTEIGTLIQVHHDILLIKKIGILILLRTDPTLILLS
jgi:hypothetical protein